MTLNPHSPSLALILCSPYILAPSSSAASLPPPRPTRTARPRPRRTGARAATSGTASPPTAPAPPPPAKKHRALVPARPPAPPLAPPRGPPPARPRPRAPTVRCVRGGSVVWSIRVCTRARVWEMDLFHAEGRCLALVHAHNSMVQVLEPGATMRAKMFFIPLLSSAHRARACRNPTSAPLLLIDHVPTTYQPFPFSLSLHLSHTHPSRPLSYPLRSPLAVCSLSACRPTAARAARCAARATATRATPLSVTSPATATPTARLYRTRSSRSAVVVSTG
jgi:hypothetical protein